MEEAPTQAYGEVDYWNGRYGREMYPFDWYQKYPSLAPLVNLYLPHRHHRVLVVGCGNSAFSEGMVDDGYEEVINIDISIVVIRHMETKYADRPHLKYIEMDARKMDDFQSGSFDGVIDKGTLDSILVSVCNVVFVLYFQGIIANRKIFHYIWSSNISSKLVERIEHVGDKAPCDSYLSHAEKHSVEEKPENPIWELTKPVPLDDEGSTVQALLGNNPDVHYIYVCTKMDSGNIEALCASLSLSDRVRDGPIQRLDVNLKNIAMHRLALCVVGKVLSTEVVNREAFMRVIGKIWRVDKGMDIESVTSNMFSFHFRDEEDMNRVLVGGPWSFDDAIIALEKPMGKGTIESMEFI
ncbi:hypothetical protein EZV62_000045 [Acer yangbiense]|uniref:DUF4283 domain-containing protein n=1 Tax=Acer yangbiense TaxID=1000413 RepID=A0A5C7ISJ8_9ROSI|nr:hypothetical protein EZV62_000045 [Acer yangbiense]